MTGKLIGRSAHLATGYWGRNIYCRVRSDQTAEKVLVQNQEKLVAMGRPALLWLPVAATTAGVVACTCDKDTTQNSDYKCMTCFGARYAPGYLKFAHETLHWSSAEHASFTLTDVEVDRTKKPNRLRLAAGEVTGTLVTQDKDFTNTALDDWELELSAYRKVAADTVALEWSTDAGATWTAVSLSAGPLYGYRGTVAGALLGTSGSVRFRVTLTRASGTSAESPSFEVLRFRHLRSADLNPYPTGARPDLGAGEVLLLKTWDQELVERTAARGRIVEARADRSWTVGLEFFDTSITPDTPAAALDDREAGPHAFFAYTTGVRQEQRYAIHQVAHNVGFGGTLTQQSFAERRVQAGEPYWLVF